jgi:hypothetical protein
MSFADLIDDMDGMIMSSLNDGRVDLLDAGGAVKASRIEAMVESNAERVDEINGAVQRVVSITVRKKLLGSYDRKGAFRSNPDQPVAALGNKVWHIDGIADDDGDLITFYVVP